MMHRVVILFTLVLLADSARAILPPDAKAREPQLRAYRQQLNINYEKRLVERRALAVRAYEQTRADIFTPPWLRDAKQTGTSSGINSADAGEKGKAQKRNHRLLASIVLLILIGSAVGWIRYATREQEQ